MTPITVTPQSPAPLTLTVRSPRLGVACRHTEGPATLRGTPDRWRIDFGAAPDITPPVSAAEDALLTEAGDAFITEAGDPIIWEAVFNPITGVGWAAAGWVDGPEFLALGLSGGANVMSWPDEKGSGDLATPGFAPTYQTSTINSKPGVRFTAAPGERMQSTVTSTQPFTWVIVADRSGGGGNSYFIGGDASPVAAIYVNGANISGHAGTDVSVATSVNNPHLLTFYANGASSTMEVDGAGTTGAGGSANPDMFCVASRGDATGGTLYAGDVVFWGRYVGDARTDPGWQDFEDWVESYYGITVA